MIIETNSIEHLKFEEINGEHIVSLIDTTNFVILKGYGETMVEAINDLHSNLI